MDTGRWQRRSTNRNMCQPQICCACGVPSALWRSAAERVATALGAGEAAARCYLWGYLHL